MATITERLAFLISADATGAIRAFDKTAAAADKQMSKATRSIDAVGTSMTKFGAMGLAAGGSLAALGTSFALAGERAATSNARIDQINKSMGLFGEEASNVTARLVKLAEQQARATGVDQNAIKLTQAKLLTFKELARTADTVGGSFDRATMAALDLAASGFGEAEQNATQLGKALQDPIKGITALRRAGVTFTESEQKKIAALVESGNLLEAQNTLLSAVESQVGGTAVATSNASDKMRVAFTQFQESIGQSLLPVFEDITKKLNVVFDSFAALNKATGGVLAKFAALGTVGLVAVSALSLIGGQLIKLRSAMFNVDAATGKLSGGLSSLGKNVAFVGGAIAAAAIVYSVYSSAKAKAEQQTKNLTEALKLESEANKESLAELIKTDPNLRRYILQLDKLGLSLNDVREYIESNTGKFKVYADVLTGQVNPNSAKYEKVMRDIAVALTGTAEVTGELASETAFLGKNTEKIVKVLQEEAEANRVAQLAIDNNTDAKVRQTTSTRLLAYQLQQMKDAIDKATKANEENKKAAEDAAAQAERQAAETARVANEVKRLRTELVGSFSSALKSAKKLVEDKQKAMADYAATVAEAITSQFSFVDALNATTQAGDNLAAAQAAVTDATRGVTDAERAARDASSDVIAARTKLNEISRDGKSTSEDVRQAALDLTQAQEKEKDATDALTAAKGKLTTANSTLATAQGEATKTFMDRLQEQADGAAAFGAKVQALLAKGISPAALQQITSAGAEAGGKIADELLSGADSQIKIDKANTLVQSLQDSAKLIGDDAAARNEFYTAGVKQAESLVAGIESVIKKYRIKLKSKNLTSKQLERLKDKFEVAVDFEYVTREFEAPSLADGGVVKARNGGTLVRVAEAGYDEAVIPLNRAGTTGSNINITVNAGMGADGTNIGRQIVDELVAYQRRVGALPIKVSM